MSKIKALFLFYKKSIKVRLLSYFLFASILPILLVGFIPYYQSKATVERQMLELSQSIVTQLNENINFFLREMDLITHNISYQLTANNRNVKETDSNINEFNQFLVQLKKSRPFIENISIKTNSHTFTTAEGIRWDVLTSTDWFIDAMSNPGENTWVGPHLNDYTINMRKSKGVISLIYPYVSNNKETITILIDMKQEEFDKLFNRPDLTNLGTLLVIDKFGEIIYSTDDAILTETIERYDRNKAYVSNKSIIEKLKQKNHYIDDINFTSGWKIVALIPENIIGESFNDIRKIVFALLAIFMVISIVLMWYISSRFTEPLRKLQRDIREVEKGNFKIRAETDAIDEVGDLSISFNNMVEEIERLIQKISINERNKKQIEMQSLQYQINPHFLYNTLNSVQWIARLHKVPDISEMLTSLIKLLRASLNSKNYLHTLEQELEMLDFYLKIQEQRYPDSFQVEYLIDSDLLSAYIPRFILQPLVENIFFHAFADGQGKISIEVTKKNNILQITVKDNGRGMKVQTAKNLLNKRNMGKRKTSSGIGIYNVEDKIKLYFGSMYGLQISSEEGKGTTIYIHLPITFEQEEDEEVAKRINSR
jgi:two-component system sensor histidine kinase YesM